MSSKLPLLDRLDDILNNTWILQRRNITKLILLTAQNLSQNSAHNLARASLGQVLDDVHALGSSKRPNVLADVQDELLAQLGRGGELGLDADKGIDGLASEFVCNTYDGRFGDRLCKQN